MPDKSDKHGAKLDDEIGRETQGMVRGGHSTHAEEFKETEPTSDSDIWEPNEPAGDAREGSPPGMSASDVEERSALARLLTGVRYPARRNEVIRNAAESGGSEEAIDTLRTLSDREYENLADIAEELGYGREERRY
ncbi:hypothetical protein BJF79_44135 [Actinomadura sp. CNU-125]|uniref:DUF2795 domain-containing protein n=1 Tax=Actinomadura sp. CNU-125 TaxID=1904961 RepID=UPI0009638191|nr:DUF2795 domain-containing protein [Actinomadura sp. CNU-125]OLT25499.1 hypothetical protein BJF79_44135 [Actinomadura sp. CNU-125]